MVGNCKLFVLSLIVVGGTGCVSGRVTNLEQRLAALEQQQQATRAELQTVARIPTALQADVAATREYMLKVENDLRELRRVMAGQMDTQNVRIMEVRAAYLSVLQSMLETNQKVNAALDEAVKKLAQPLLSSAEVVPGPPPPSPIQP
jgi:chromosome segregation ATPase